MRLDLKFGIESRRISELTSRAVKLPVIRSSRAFVKGQRSTDWRKGCRRSGRLADNDGPLRLKDPILADLVRPRWGTLKLNVCTFLVDPLTKAEGCPLHLITTAGELQPSACYHPAMRLDRRVAQRCRQPHWAGTAPETSSQWYPLSRRRQFDRYNRRPEMKLS